MKEINLGYIENSTIGHIGNKTSILEEILSYLSVLIFGIAIGFIIAIKIVGGQIN